MSPRLSIGLPVYNGAKYLTEAVQALLSQSYDDFELVISDNASTDETGEICRRYAARDPRVRYLRQHRNIGAAPNHNVVLNAARGELFKWASHDDLYHPQLLERCVAALDEHPDVVLASCLSTVIDESGQPTGQRVDYPPALDSQHVPDRFAGVLFGLGGDDDYGVIRIDTLRRTHLSGSHYHADRTLVAELALHGTFHRVPAELYSRRDLPDRAGSPKQSIRRWCVTHDPRRANRLRHPTIRLLGEYVWVLVDAVRRAPLTSMDKRQCYAVLLGYLADRVRPSALKRSANQRQSGQEPQRETSFAVAAEGEDSHLTTRNPLRRRGRRAGSAPRVGLFGLLGAGNLGNDGSLEAVLGYLRSEHPDAVISAFCSGPERVRQRYGIAATNMHWYGTEDRAASGARSAVLKAIGRVLDAGRTLFWVRNQDIVIVPGAGVLEATLPVRPWGVPYALLCLSAAGRLADTKVLFVSVGASVVRGRASRWMFTKAATLAHYRSYRDGLSRDAMRDMGVDTAVDPVYPDLAFALPAPAHASGARGTVGLGVMSYHGSNDDRRRADEINRAYLDVLRRFVRWLVDEGKNVRLFVGDNVDVSVTESVLADLREQRPRIDPTRVVFQPAADLAELMRQMATVDTVVATRYHNVLCALKLAKPTLSLSYGVKNDTLMASMGLGEFCQSARSIDFDHLVDQFRALETRGDELAKRMRERNRVNQARLNDQFTILSKTLSAATESIEHEATRRGLS